jgi:threonine/homoserine/homoserine lactone efflux protein
VADPATLAVFAGAALVLLVTPGPAVLYIVARSLDQGRAAGLVSVLGVATGALFHVAAAALGLSALLVSSSVAFDVVRYAGAAYLVYLGVRKLAGPDEAPGGVERAPRTLASLYAQGVVVNLLNPKTALFFLAFLPQFVDADRGHVAAQVLFLGLVFVLLGVLSDGAWALGAGSIGGWLRGRAGVVRARRYLTGGTFIALGLAAAASGPARK